MVKLTPIISLTKFPSDGREFKVGITKSYQGGGTDTTYLPSLNKDELIALSNCINEYLIQIK